VSVLVSAKDPKVVSASEREFHTRIAPRDTLEGPATFFPSERIVHPIEKRRDAIFADHVSIGRTRTNDIQIDDPSISKFHAYFRLDAQGAVEAIVDAESTNGTFVNDRRLDPKEPAPLAEGDRVVLGGLSFSFHTAQGFYDLLQSIDQSDDKDAMLWPSEYKPSE
jgi:pSer/pThr/pTyr-binding forkhead associated (FHA) protein